MKTKLLIMLLAICGIANAQTWQWAQSAGGTSVDKGRSCCTDGSGNVIAAGYFSSSSITFGTTTLTNANPGTADMFIVKYDASGNVLWAMRAGDANSNDYANGCATDGSGNIIVTGSFTGSSITFGTITLTSADNASYADMFIVKYDPNGNVLWAKSAGGPNSNGDDYGHSCATDASGNIIATGYFGSSPISFGTINLFNTNAPNMDIFIVKYSSAGTALWAQSAGGTNNDFGYSCTTDGSGNIIATGSFASSSITLGTTTLTNAGSGSSDMFIVKYASSGNVLWAQRAGGTSNDPGFGCATDAGGNIIATGSFKSSSIIFGTTTLTNASGSGGIDDMFIVKYGANGNVLWAQRAGGTDFDYFRSCSTDGSGNVIATGYFSSSSIAFGTITLTNANPGTDDMFIVKYDASGNVLWAIRAGGVSYDYGESCSTDANGNIIATAWFGSPSITFGSTTLTNAGGSNDDMFIVKLDSATATGIEENVFSGEVSIYPNPFSTQTVLQTNIPLTNATLTLFNCFGQTVAQIKNLSGQTITFNRDNLASGLYFVRLTVREDSFGEENKTIAVDKLVIADR